MPRRPAQSLVPPPAAVYQPPPPPVTFMAERMPKQRGRCVSAICVSWKVFTCIFSHVLLVTLVVAYCLLGAKTFEYLEKKNEIEVKKSISFIRGNLTEGIWQLTYSQPVLYEQNWTLSVIGKLQAFETDILNSMKVRGWDGNEDTEKLQWTFMGALFYSIIVITTIGYGHIAPKTFMGKISTIFYAILGIPLMLLCLSNIGDIMASSFRFIYWRVCCFVCTREPRRASRRPGGPGGGGGRNGPGGGPAIAYGPPPSALMPPPPGYDVSGGGGVGGGGTFAGGHVYRLPGGGQHQPAAGQPSQLRHPSAKSNPSTMRRSIRISQRTTDSGLGNSYHERSSQSQHLQHAHSDTELRYSDQRTWDRNANSKSTPNKNRHAMATSGGRAAAAAAAAATAAARSDRHTVERERMQPHYRQQPPLATDTLATNYTPMNRRRSMNPSRRYGRSQSMAPMETPAAIGGRGVGVGGGGGRHHQQPQPLDRNTMTLPASYGRNRNKQRSNVVRAQSLDPRERRHTLTAFDDDNGDGDDCKAPVLCNKYAIDELDNGRGQRGRHQPHGPHQLGRGVGQPGAGTQTLNRHQHREHREQQQRGQQQRQQQRCQSMPRSVSHQQQHQHHQHHQHPARYGPQHQPKGMADRNRYLDVQQQQQQQQHQSAPMSPHSAADYYQPDAYDRSTGFVGNYRQQQSHPHPHQQQPQPQQHHQQQQQHRQQQLYRHANHNDLIDDDDDDDSDDDDNDDDFNADDLEDYEAAAAAGRGRRGARSANRASNATADDNLEMHPIRKHHRRRERQGPPLPPSPRIMTPMGFAIHRQARYQAAYYDDDSGDCDAAGGDWAAGDWLEPGMSRVRPVPIWLCVFLVVSYIIAGAFLFSSWEGWSFLDSAYFCFITLTTIGFGDFVPAQGVKENPEMSIAFCSLYLLFGIALLAMSFNLVQEEVIANVKNVARQLGILKEEEYY